MTNGEADRGGIGYGAAMFSVAVIALMTYLTFAAVQGEFGLFRLIQVQGQEEQLTQLLDRLEAERAVIANRTRRLSADHLDLDLLDERARHVLGLVHPDEIVIR
jgi:cell division protein FtsB